MSGSALAFLSLTTMCAVSLTARAEPIVVAIQTDDPKQFLVERNGALVAERAELPDAARFQLAELGEGYALRSAGGYVTFSDDGTVSFGKSPSKNSLLSIHALPFPPAKPEAERKDKGLFVLMTEANSHLVGVRDGKLSAGPNDDGKASKFRLVLVYPPQSRPLKVVLQTGDGKRFLVAGRESLAAEEVGFAEATQFHLICLHRQANVYALESKHWYLGLDDGKVVLDKELVARTRLEVEGAPIRTKPFEPGIERDANRGSMYFARRGTSVAIKEGKVVGGKSGEQQWFRFILVEKP